MSLFASLFLAMLYTTDFSGFAPENPISEGGAWTNTVNATWNNPVHTLASPFRAVGAGVSSNDAVAMLTGAWGPTQTISAQCYVGSPPTGGEEIELHLRMTMIPGATDNIHTYEIDIIPALGELVIARWNSFQGDFTVLATFAPVTSISNIVDNDLFVATIVGPGSNALIVVTQNGVEIGRVTDNDGLGFSTGSPGIGMDNDTANIFGWRTYSATDFVPGPGIVLGNYTHPGRSPGLAGISSARFQSSNWWPYTFTPPPAFDGALMAAMEKHGNDPLVLPPQVVASGMTPPEEMPT